MSTKIKSLGGLLLVVLTTLSCEIDTKLRIDGGNPPQFLMSGSGNLGRLVVRGPKTLRHIEGPDSSAYWYIEIKNPRVANVWRLSPIKYGTVPEGYVQKYPELGAATPLSEKEIYYVRVDTSEANGTSKAFVIKNGKVEFADYESELSGK
jgi:hypothetical protein